MQNGKNDQAGESRRVSNYPYLPLLSCLKVAEAVKELGGARSDVPKSVLAKQLGESEKSGTFSQRMTATKSYGLVEGHGAYTLSDIANRYYFPTNESDRSTAFLEMFSSPPVFGVLIRRFDGDRMPSKDILANILHRELKVPESWMDRVASFFINAAQLVGAMDEQGFLRFSAAKHSVTASDTAALGSGAAPAQSLNQEEIASSPQVPSQLPTSKPNGINVWSFSANGKTVQLHTSEELDMSIWDKLNKYVQLLKPDDT